MLDLYTYIMDIDGGTYIAQVKSINMDTSIDLWLDKIENTPELKKELSATIFKSIREEIHNEDYYPIKIRETQSVWYAHLTTSIGVCDVHIIKTVRSSDLND